MQLKDASPESAPSPGTAAAQAQTAAAGAGRLPGPARSGASDAPRRPLGPRIGLGVRALDLFTPCCEGQRIGIFAGSGVGKSSLMSMIARGIAADVLVIGLIGERGR